MIHIYAEINGSEHIISGDFAQASSPLWVDGKQTPYQVADARHKCSIAVAICLAYIGEANLPTCPADMTPDLWQKKVEEDFPDWDDVEYRDATDEEVGRIEAKNLGKSTRK